MILKPWIHWFISLQIKRYFQSTLTNFIIQEIKKGTQVVLFLLVLSFFKYVC